MNEFTALVKKIQQVRQAPWEEQRNVFADIFHDPMTLVIARYGTRSVRCVVAICDVEVAPLKTKFYAPFRLAKSPVSMADVEIETRPIEIAELCAENDPDNGIAPEGSEYHLLNDLLKRFMHLEGKDLAEVESWVWYEHEPYPIINGKLNFRPRKYDFSIRDEDEWFELPLQSRSDYIHYYTGLDYTTPKRLALTMPDGFMRAFDMEYGFIGPEDFVWLKALPTSVRARASFEGIRAADMKDMPRNPEEKNAGWPPGTERFDRGDEPPRVTGTHAYGPGWQHGTLIRLTQQGMSLIPGTCSSKEDADHMVALIARDGDTLDGTWQISEDGASWNGPSLDKVEHSWWGFSVRIGHGGACPGSTWRVILVSTCDFAGPEFLEPPKLGPGFDYLIGYIEGDGEAEQRCGAISSRTGEVMIPFDYVSYEEIGMVADCVVFTDKHDRHNVFDENGKRVLGPLKTFEIPDEFRERRYASRYETSETEEERRKSYIRFDLLSMYQTAKANKRFGDLDRHAPTLKAYAGCFKEGRKDAELAGLWNASVEIVSDGEIYGTALKKGMSGHVSFGAVVQIGGSSMFDWETELPVTGLADPENPERVIGVPFDMLRVRKSSERKSFFPDLSLIDWKEWLSIARGFILAFTGLMLILQLMWDGLPLRELCIGAVFLYMLFWGAEAYLETVGKQKEKPEDEKDKLDEVSLEKSQEKQFVLYEKIQEGDWGYNKETVIFTRNYDGSVNISNSDYGEKNGQWTEQLLDSFIKFNQENAQELKEDFLHECFSEGWGKGIKVLIEWCEENDVAYEKYAMQNN